MAVSQSQRQQLVVFRLHLFLLCLLCLSGICQLAQAKDDTSAYTKYAEIQQAEASGKIAPYVADIQAIAQRAYQPQPPVTQHQLQPSSSFNNTSDHAQNPEVATPGDILIFVSFSMPETSLRQWSKQAQRFHATLIVRGLVNGSFAQTQARMFTLFGDEKESKNGMVLEPRLFADYQITQVPAVVVRNTAITCPMTQNCPHVYPFDVLMGDIGLEEALAVMARENDHEMAQLFACIDSRKKRT